MAPRSRSARTAARRAAANYGGTPGARAPRAAGPGTVAIPILRLPGNEDLPLPEPATPDSAGVDLRAAILEPIALAPGERALVPTGFALALPRGYEGQVRPRSGLALKFGLTLLNTPGTIDADYRGEVAVIAVNLGGKKVAIRRGDRIAQLVVAPVTAAAFAEVRELPASPRGGGGFGHTGRR